jgi:predicted transcriptional regulator
MTQEDILNECLDPKQSITIELPCAMAERVQKLAKENNTNLSNILIEALDSFLRNQSL